MAAGPRLGIDFGTSHTVALIAWPDGRVRPLLFDGSPLLPSSVYAQADGQVLVGRDAVHAARVDPSRFEGSPKRRIDDGTVLLGDREFTVPALIGAVLSHVAQEAKRVAGGQISALTLTHPAAWGVSRRLALVEGATIAGLPQPALMPEPVAAAHYFAGVLQRPLAADQGLLVYDFGGGTFDASIVTRAGDGFDVRAVDGIDDLGGIDLDALIVDHGKQQLDNPEVWARLESPQTTEDRRHRRLLWDDARVAKEMLSRTPATGLHVPIAASDITITREAFEDLARPLLEQTVRTTAAVVRWAGLDKSRLAGLFLVGGSSRIPLVATLLQKELGVAPTIIEQPELVVAEGSLRAWVNVGAAAGASQAGYGAVQGGQQGTPGGPGSGGQAVAAGAGMAAAAGAAVATGGAVGNGALSGAQAAAAGLQGAPATPAAFQQGGQPAGGAFQQGQPAFQQGQPALQQGQQGQPAFQQDQPGQQGQQAFHQGQPGQQGQAFQQGQPGQAGQPAYQQGQPGQPGQQNPQAFQQGQPAQHGAPQHPGAFQPGQSTPQGPSTPPGGVSPVSGTPVSGSPISGAPMSGQPMSGPPAGYHPGAAPVSAAPVSPVGPGGPGVGRWGADAEATQPLRARVPQAAPPPVYVSPAATPMVYAPPPREDEPLGPPPRSRSVAIPLLIGILVLALALAGYVVFQERGSDKDNASSNPTASQTTSAGASTGPSAVVIPAYSREDRPAWVPSGWKVLQREPDEWWYSQDESEGGHCEASPESLHVTTKRNGLTGCTLQKPLDYSMTDAAIEAKVHVSVGCAGLWARTGDKGYTVGLCKGSVQLYALGDSAPGPNNRLGDWPIQVEGDPYVALLVKGSSISVYVNGHLFGPVNHELITKGRVNLGAFTGGDPADVAFSDVRVWTPPSSTGGGSPNTSPSATRSGWPSSSSSPSPSWKPTPTSTLGG